MDTPQPCPRSAFTGIPACVDMLDAVAAVAPTARPVFLVSRRGTGSLLLAHTIHRASLRANREFSVIRCGLCPPSTVDLQLFGSRSSARGKSSRLSGKILGSDGGTLFVEQVQNASPEAQRALLQVLEDREFTVGGVTHAVDVRVIVSAPSNLERHVAEKRFRADLFYRLNAMPIPVPATLRSREDILGILAATREPAPVQAVTGRHEDVHAAREVAQSWRRLADAVNRAREGLGGAGSPEDLLLRTLAELHRVPADTHRQLENIVVSAAWQCVAIHARLVSRTYDSLLIEFQRALIRRAITECNGMLSCAAALLGLTTPELESRLGDVGLSYPL